VPGVSPGIVDVDDLLAVILAWGPCPLEDNDTCAGAIFMSPGDTEVGETETATADDEAFACGGTTIQSEGVWYMCTGTGNTMTATLCEGTDFDTVVYVYCAGDDPFAPCAGMGCLGSNDQSLICNEQGGSFDQSRFTWCSELGKSYMIYVSGWSGDNGNFTLTLEDDGVPCMDAPACAYPPPNDECSGAIALMPGESDTRSTELASDDPQALSCGGRTPQGPGTWYTVTGTGNVMTVDLCESDFNNQVYVYCAGESGEPCGAVSCIGSDDFSCGAQASFTWCSAAGQPYLVYVCGWNGSVGEYTITLDDDGAPCADPLECEPVVPNDSCVDAIEISAGVTPFSTINATSGGPFLCTGASRDIWFTHTVECLSGGGLLLISTCPNDGGAIQVFDRSGGLDGTCGDLSSSLIACSEEGICDSLQIPVLDGQQLLIRLGGWTNQGDDVGTGELSIECIDTGDDICYFADEVDLSGGLAEVQVDNCGATIDSLAPVCGSSNPPEAPGRWIEFVGTGEEVTISLCNSSNPSYDEGNPGTWLDTRLLVYCGASAGEPCALLKCAADEQVDNNDACPLTETVTVCTEPGRSYFALVVGAGDFGAGCEGLVDVTFTTGPACDDPPCPSNESPDFAEDAFDVTDFINGDPVIGTTIGATPPPHDADPSQRDPQLPLGSPSCSWLGNPDLCYGTVWYKFTAPENGSVTAQTCESLQARDTVMMLYSGTPGGFTEIFCAEDECNPYFRSILTATGLNPGEVYYLVVAHSAALDSMPGEFQLDLTSP
jgi:hypothetical protein